MRYDLKCAHCLRLSLCPLTPGHAVTYNEKIGLTKALEESMNPTD